MKQLDLIVLKPKWVEDSTELGRHRTSTGLAVIFNGVNYPHYHKTAWRHEALRGFYFYNPLNASNRQFKKDPDFDLLYGKKKTQLKLMIRQFGKLHYPVGVKVGRVRPGFAGLQQLRTLRKLKKIR